MDTRDLRYFRLVYEEGSINKAAGELFITPQGLSRIIRKLEYEFQAVLFERTSTGTIPTEYGDYLYTHSRELLYHMENIKQKMKQLNTKQSILHIGFACGTLNVLDLEHLLYDTGSHSSFQFQWEEMENQEVTQKLLNNTLDVGFIIGTNSSTELKAITVYTGKMNALVYEGHQFYNYTSLSIKELKDQPLISLNEKYASYHNLIQRCSDFDFVPNIAISTMENTLIYRFCNKKLGIGIDADIHKDNTIPEGIHKIEIKDAIPWKISLLYRHKHCNENIISKLKEYIIIYT